MLALKILLPVARHSDSPSSCVTFGCLNIRSLESKLDDLLEVCRGHSLHVDVMLLTETWHDPDSVCVRRLRADGFTVVERARPRVQSATLAVNHGGVLAATAASSGVRLVAVDIGLHPATFEAICVRLTAVSVFCIALFVYNRGLMRRLRRFSESLPMRWIASKR
jgi:hypothetical protein